MLCIRAKADDLVESLVGRRLIESIDERVAPSEVTRSPRDEQASRMLRLERDVCVKFTNDVPDALFAMVVDEDTSELTGHDQ